MFHIFNDFKVWKKVTILLNIICVILFVIIKC